MIINLKIWLFKLLGSPRRKYMRFVRKKLLSSGSTEDRFTWIHDTKQWGCEESVSGPGSTIRYTENLRRSLPTLFNHYKIHSVFDAPCGDFNWMREVVKLTNISYFGADVVQQLVRNNQERYKSPHVDFGYADITQTPLPTSDLMICRDCLFHFSYDDIDHFIKNFCRSDIKFLLTTTHLNTSGFENTNIFTGNFRLIDLFKAPFLFPEPLFSIDDWIDPYPPRQMCLWSKEQLLDVLRKTEESASIAVVT